MRGAATGGEAAAAAAWLGLGANLGDRRAGLAAMRASLVGGGLRLEAASIEMVTRPSGVARQPDFRNQVVRLGSSGPLEPLEWLRRCQAAERAAGRLPTYRWGPRRGDADVLLLGERGDLRVDHAALQVPHPELERRPFFCALLASIEPGLRHPDGWRFADRAGHLLVSC